jgi:hypothetical protein
MHRTLVARKGVGRPLTPHALLPQTSPTWRGASRTLQNPARLAHTRWVATRGRWVATRDRRCAAMPLAQSGVARPARSSPEPAQDAEQRVTLRVTTAVGRAGRPYPLAPPFLPFTYGRRAGQDALAALSSRQADVCVQVSAAPAAARRGCRAAHAARGRPQNLKRSTIAEMLSLLPRLYASSVSRFAAFSASCGAATLETVTDCTEELATAHTPAR